jgi:glycosyltransferase involved in cell wall biosynthesis
MPNYYFSFVVQKNFSGQSRAAEQIIESLNSKYKVIILNQYSFNRKGNKIVSLVQWFVKTFSISPKLFKLLFDYKPILHISIGQEWASILRILWWYFPVVVFKKPRIIISLNGRNFETWQDSSRLKKIFAWILNEAEKVTVVGPSQKSTLLNKFNITREIVVVPNTSDINEIKIEEVLRKFDAEKPIQILFLSLLIESKGFKLYLDSLLNLVENNKIQVPVHAYICGTISFSKYCKTFNNSESKVENYINETIQKLIYFSKQNKIEFKIEWINGIRGAEKESMFKNTHLFVLPTFFPTESQPLVLLEAMSSGCCIITSNVGEIEYIVGGANSIIYEPNKEKLASLISTLVHDRERMLTIGIENYRRYQKDFSKKSYENKWNQIFNSEI